MRERAPPAQSLAELRARHEAADECVLDAVRAFISEQGMRDAISRVIDAYHVLRARQAEDVAKIRAR